MNSMENPDLDQVGGDSARELRRALVSDALNDEAIDQAGDQGIALTGDGGLLPELVKAVLGHGLAVELDDHLGYAKDDPAGRDSPNSRNGSAQKTLGTEFGQVPLDVPRDRATSFDPRLVPKGARRLDCLDEMIVSWYAGGMPIRDIQHHPAFTIGTELSAERILNITDAVLDEVLTWQTRQLDNFYPVVFMDALVVKVKDNKPVRNSAAHIAVRVDTHGIKHVLGIWIQASEGAKFWAQVCAELANVGVRDFIIACVEGATGFAEAISTTWPHTHVQTCVVHLIRSSMRFLNYKDRKIVAAGVKRTYTAMNDDAGLAAIEVFEASGMGRKYPATAMTWRAA